MARRGVQRDGKDVICEIRHYSKLVTSPAVPYDTSASKYRGHAHGRGIPSVSGVVASSSRFAISGLQVQAPPPPHVRRSWQNQQVRRIKRKAS
jgi:hypothetical protein